MDTKYNMNNIAISLGWNCQSATWAVDAGIRMRKSNGYKTCPFDIMVTNYKGIVECINDNFKYMCDEKYLELRQESENVFNIYNTKYNFIFNHESPGVANLYKTENWAEGINHFVNNNYRNLKIRYNNRIDNFRKYLSNPLNSITFVITSWDRTPYDVPELRDVFLRLYPRLRYTVITNNTHNGKDYYIQHLRSMGFTDEDYEIKRIL